MFYSHEVLTSREHGVATVWLVATLGSKSTLNKKVNKKAILEVKIPDACKTILSPSVPMALRLQSNLLYGVTRVYGEKVGYVLVDAQHAQNDIRTLLRVVRVETTELEGKHKARPDQLVLQEDSNALLEDILGLDFDPFEDLTTSGSSQASSILSPHCANSSGLGSEHADPSIGGLIIPPSASSATGGPGGFSARGSTIGDDNRVTSRFGSAFFIRDEPGVLEDPGFDFNADGELVDVGSGQQAEREPSVQMPGPELRADILMNDYDDTTIDDRAQANDSWQRDEDDGYLPAFNDLNVYSNVEAFPARDQESARPESVQAEADPDAPVETSESSASAPARRVRQSRVLHNDETMELHNHDLAKWSTNYLANMQIAMNQKLRQRTTKLAKDNANFWVLQNGVGGLAYAIGPEEIPEPLRMFTGNALLAALTGLQLDVAGEKRDREEEVADEEEDVDMDGRRIRARSDEAEMGRGDGDIMMDHAGYVDGDDMRDDTIEMGREAPTPLADNMSSTMPWNLSASIRGSSARPGAAAPFSVGGGGGHASSSIAGGPVGFLGGRVSRVVSASPLIGYGGGDNDNRDNFDDYQIPGDDYEGFEHGDQTGAGTRDGDADADAVGLTLSRRQEDFELFGVAAAVDTQTAGAPSWVRQALDSESANFLSFVRAGIEEADIAREGVEEEELEELDQKGSVLFEELLPHAENSRIVAAQALLHVLTLATKNMLHAEQRDHFQAISMRIS